MVEFLKKSLGGLVDIGRYKTKWTVTKFADADAHARGEHYEVVVIDGNLLLNEGINEMLLLITGLGGTAFNSVNAFLGVGDSITAAAATQTGLQAAVNKLYKAMDAGFPTVTNQTMNFRATFQAAEANFAWEEFSVANGSNETTAKNINRKVISQGTKTSPQVYQLDLSITLA